MTDPPAEAITADPNPEGNPALAAAVEAIVKRRLASQYAGLRSPANLDRARAAILIDALPDATVALLAATPIIRGQEAAKLQPAIDRVQRLAEVAQAKAVEHALAQGAAAERTRLSQQIADMPKPFGISSCHDEDDDPYWQDRDDDG